MNCRFILVEGVQMTRRTINLPESVDALIRDLAEPEESFSAAVVRLVEAGARAAGTARVPSWIGSGEGPGDLGRRAEEYLREPTTSA